MSTHCFQYNSIYINIRIWTANRISIQVSFFLKIKSAPGNVLVSMSRNNQLVPAFDGSHAATESIRRRLTIFKIHSQYGFQGGAFAGSLVSIHTQVLMLETR